MYLTVNNAEATEPPADPTKGWGEVFVQDHANDIGQIPSTLGGEPFWASEDIVVVPAGTVDVPLTQQAWGAALIVGQAYDVYVRVHNSGCQDVTGVGAVVYSAIVSWTGTDGDDNCTTAACSRP